jgi:hypothetical protein
MLSTAQTNNTALYNMLQQTTHHDFDKLAYSIQQRIYGVQEQLASLEHKANHYNTTAQERFNKQAHLDQESITKILQHQVESFADKIQNHMTLQTEIFATSLDSIVSSFHDEANKTADAKIATISTMEHSTVEAVKNEVQQIVNQAKDDISKLVDHTISTAKDEIQSLHGQFNNQNTLPHNITPGPYPKSTSIPHR